MSRRWITRDRLAGKEEKMLSEIRHVRQIRGEGTRRWFKDHHFDLIVWYDDDNSLSGFQLCYDTRGQERAFTWTREHGSQHERIDAGETPGHSRMSPVIVADDAPPGGRVAERFLMESARVDPEIARLVYDTISRYPSRIRETDYVV
jgi:hypothetical protein